jgi:hypothetical protein
VAEGAQHAVGHVKEQAAQAVTETAEQTKGSVQRSL